VGKIGPLSPREARCAGGMNGGGAGGRGPANTWLWSCTLARRGVSRREKGKYGARRSPRLILDSARRWVLTGPGGDWPERPAENTPATTRAVDLTAMPAILQQRWMTGPRDVSGALGVSLVFGPRT